MHRAAFNSLACLSCLPLLTLLAGPSSMTAALAQTTASPAVAHPVLRPEERSTPQPTFAPDRPRAAAYWHDSWRGWHFYEPEPEPSDGDLSPRLSGRSAAKLHPPSSSPLPLLSPLASPQAPPASAASSARAPELIEFDQLQRALEEFRHIAIMRPTEGNVRRYMALESSVVARASYFADVAQRVAWSTPELDPSVHGRPVNAKALEVFEQRQRDNRTATAAALGRDHVLLFFFRSDCPYCHAFAPTLRALEVRHGLQVVPVSLDGGAIPSYPGFRRDNGIANALNVTQVPAVFLAQPFSGTITPIGFGVLSESQLLERIAAVSTPESHAMLPGATRRLALP